MRTAVVCLLVLRPIGVKARLFIKFLNVRRDVWGVGVELP